MDEIKQRIRPYEGAEPYIFISYAHRDYDRIAPILRELAGRGYRFWYDEGIDPGTEWPESIARHLERSSVCLSFISPYSAASKNCRREINFALSRNIPLLTVFLEETKLSSGLELQISTYQSIMGYKYPDLDLLMERIASVDVMKPCGGTPGKDATVAGYYGQNAPVPRKRKALPIAMATVLVLTAAAALLLPKIETGQTESEDVNATVAVQPVTPAPVLPASVEQLNDESDNWTEHLWDDPPITASDPLPEGYRLLVYGEWGYGSLLVYGNEHGSIRFALTDDRIPNGFPMSQIPGKNDPYWCVMLHLSAKDTLHVNIGEQYIPSSFAGLETDVTLFSENETIYYDSFPYSLTGSTLLFGIRLPEPFTADDIQAVGVSVGTELPNYVDSYDFYP